MRNVVITGVTRGLGWELTRYFAKQGDRVIGCGRSDERIAQLREEFGPEHSFHRVDVASDEDVAAWAGTVSGLGPAGLLLNNAAVTAPNAPLWKLDARQTQEVVDINLIGTINVIRHFLPPMIQQGTGVVVNFSSGWGRSTSPEVATYCATKYAIEGLTAALAQELPPGLAAVALNPGVINTDMLATCFGASAADYPSPAEWIKFAGPFLSRLEARHNGKSLDVPGVPTD